MPAPKHTDPRGFFQELYHFNADDKPYVQVSHFSIEPGQKRGGHFHAKTHEMFFVLSGSVQYSERASTGKLQRQVVEEGGKCESHLGVYHEFYSERGAHVLAFSTRHFNASDPDTYTEDTKHLRSLW